MNAIYSPNEPEPIDSQKLKDLLNMSRHYGANAEYVLAGGGNSSVKFNKTLLVKASGYAMADLDRDGLVAMDTRQLNRIWNVVYPSGPDRQDEREKMVLKDMMAARYSTEGQKRPSVEALLHAAFPQSYVMHTHPALVNGLTCAKEGANLTLQLFGPNSGFPATWIKLIEPGYVLARRVKEILDASPTAVNIVFLENHGIFVAGHSLQEIDHLYTGIFDRLQEYIAVKPDPKLDDFEVTATAGGSVLQRLMPHSCILGFRNSDILNFSSDEKNFEPLKQAFTPDHIVYAGYRPVYAQSASRIEDVVRKYSDEDGGRFPVIVVVSGEGAYSCHETLSRARTARELFWDAVKIAIYAKNFGGSKPLSPYMISFIRNWEVEKYRVSITQ